MVHAKLPSGLMLISASPEGSWKCRTSTDELTCRLMGDIPTGSQPKIRLTARASNPGAFNVCASVNLVAVKEDNLANNTSCAMLRIGGDQSPTKAPSLIVPPKHTDTPKKSEDDMKGKP
jgi:hypothetical protein